MPAKQKTIKYSVSCTGVGLHTGVQSTVTFHPADEILESNLLEMIKEIKL